MSVDEVLGWLREALKDLESFNGGMHRNERWTRWDHEMRSILRNTFGPTSPESSNYFAAIDRSFWVVGGGNETVRENKRIDYFHGILVELHGWLEALILQVERFGIKSSDEPHESDESSPVEPNDKASVPWRYLVTSPVFLVEKSVGLLINGWGWCTENRGISTLFGVTMLVAAVLTIAGVIKL